ncbi:MAG: hemin uptake protein HemP [Pseudohongiellaceae bacterium]
MPNKTDLSKFKRTVTSEELIGNAKELTIVHNNEKYVIRITSNNKLILTK